MVMTANQCSWFLMKYFIVQYGCCFVTCRYAYIILKLFHLQGNWLISVRKGKWMDEMKQMKRATDAMTPLEESSTKEQIVKWFDLFSWITSAIHSSQQLHFKSDIINLKKTILKSYFGLSLQGTLWWAETCQHVIEETHRPRLVSGTPAEVSQPTGPAPPWLHCGVPSVDTHQLSESRNQNQSR